MDPNATLKYIEDECGPECKDACADLHAWLLNGGFPPVWADYKLGTWKYDQTYGPS